jgi:hypothetical protein
VISLLILRHQIEDQGTDLVPDNQEIFLVIFRLTIRTCYWHCFIQTGHFVSWLILCQTDRAYLYWYCVRQIRHTPLLLCQTNRRYSTVSGNQDIQYVTLLSYVTREELFSSAASPENDVCRVSFSWYSDTSRWLSRHCINIPHTVKRHLLAYPEGPVDSYL